MNLWSVLSLGGSSVLKTLWNAISGKSQNNLDSVLGKLDKNVDLADAIENLSAKYTGSSLTNAEREANAFTAEREDIAWQRQMDASNTVYQRQVADMQAAGLNPMMAVSSGGSAVPSASASGSVSPSGASLNLGSILSAINGMQQLKLQEKLIDAQVENTEADTGLKQAQAASTSQQVDYFASVAPLRKRAEELSNDMSESRISEINQSIKESMSRVSKNASESEAAVQRALLDAANAHNIQYMQPFLSAKASAETDVAILDAAYKQGLLDSGAIAASVRASNASASESEVRAQVESIEKQLKSKENAMTPDMLNGSWGEKAVAGIRVIVKTILGK